MSTATHPAPPPISTPATASVAPGPRDDGTSELVRRVGAMASASPRRGRPTYELLDFFPDQGDWTVDEYLSLDTMRLIEFTDGVLEFLPMPTGTHQDIAAWIWAALHAILSRRGGKARIAPFKVRLSKKVFREPDVCALLDAKDPRSGDKYWCGADLVVEVASPDDPDRDYVEKRRDYARVGVKEYWIVDPRPRHRSIRVLSLDGKRYRVAGTYRAGEVARSVLLDEWSVSVDEMIALIAAAPADEPPAASAP